MNIRREATDLIRALDKPSPGALPLYWEQRVKLIEDALRKAFSAGYNAATRPRVK